MRKADACNAFGVRGLLTRRRNRRGPRYTAGDAACPVGSARDRVLEWDDATASDLERSSCAYRDPDQLQRRTLGRDRPPVR